MTEGDGTILVPLDRIRGGYRYDLSTGCYGDLTFTEIPNRP